CAAFASSSPIGALRAAGQLVFQECPACRVPEKHAGLRLHAFAERRDRTIRLQKEPKGRGRVSFRVLAPVDREWKSLDDRGTAWRILCHRAVRSHHYIRLGRPRALGELQRSSDNTSRYVAGL